MINNNELENMVLDLKYAESSTNFEELLSKVSTDNNLYNALKEASEHETQDKEMLFYELRSWFCLRMEKSILTYLKEII